MTTNAPEPLEDAFGLLDPPPPRDLFAPFGGFGHSFLVLGPPKTGKSDFAGSCARLGRTLVLATKPREANSRLYVAEPNCDREVFHDPGWMPSVGAFTAGGFLALLKRLRELQTDDTYDFVVLDTYNDANSLAAHELLKLEGAASPQDLGDSQRFYGSIFYRLDELTKAITALAFAKHPKHVIVNCHMAPAREDQVGKGGAVRKSADTKAKGIEYEGSVLPQLEGRFRFRAAGDFDMVLYSDIVTTTKVVDVGAGKKEMRTLTEYVMQARPDTEKHAGGVLSALLDKTIPNDFAEILRAVEAARR